MPAGAVVGVGTLTACLQADSLFDRIEQADYLSGNYARGRFGFRVEGFRPLAEPIPLTGRQGFFEWLPPADLEDRLLPAVDHAAAAQRWMARAA